ncbi:Cation-transporting P-type ATPase, N-terminal [Fusarium oxysporum f. sp. vasinfectum]|nr:Cation-transporting P-type ATPase, N-terminal [Fusarium oxysporum f. sp. vasinfectum]
MSQQLMEEKPHVSGQSNTPMTAPAHALTFEQVAEQLQCHTVNGLRTAEAERRLKECGRNEFGEQQSVQPIKILIGQIANALTLMSTIPWPFQGISQRLWPRCPWL